MQPAPDIPPVVRSSVLGDAAHLWDVERAIVKAGKGTVQELEDLPSDLPAYRALLEARLADPFQHLVVADVRGSVVGYAEWSRLRPAKLRHVVSVAIGVHPEFQRRGIGESLLRRLLADAGRASPPIGRVELGVLADNEHARRLYERLGFRIEGVRRAFVRDESGVRDDCLMALLL